MARTVVRWGAGLVLLPGLLVLCVETRLPAQGKDEVIKIVVAKVDLVPGTMITDPAKQLALKPFLKSSLPDTVITDPADVKGRMIGRVVDRGMPVTLRDFSFVSDLFRPAEPGYRAMSIKVDAAAGVSGFVVPGARVDVIAAGGLANTPQARLVLQNVLVLAVTVPAGITPGLPPDKDSKESTTQLTFAVKPQEGLKLAEAIALPNTKVTLMLRRPGDDGIVDVPGTGKP